MSSKSLLYESKNKRLRYDVAVVLRNIADQIAAGTIQIEDELGAVCINVGDEIKFEMEIKEKSKDAGVKHSVEIELEWLDNAPRED